LAGDDSANTHGAVAVDGRPSWDAVPSAPSMGYHCCADRTDSRIARGIGGERSHRTGLIC